jgi:alpha-L-fucosidase 2
LAAEVLEHVLEAGRILKLDDPLAPRFREVLCKLRPLKIGSGGQLLEYDDDYPEAEIHHRHLSHLYGAYPGELFTPERHPELFNACEVSLVRRGDHSTGWAMGWRLALWARFRNPVKTKVMLKEFLTPIDPAAKIDSQAGGIYPNLFAAHPPFQIDANFGGAAGILEMLIQSHRQTEAGLPILELLPAVPDDWREGSLSGVRCRGGLLVDFAWRDGAVTRLRIAARVARTIRLVTPQGIDTITLAAGENCEKNFWGANHGTL